MSKATKQILTTQLVLVGLFIGLLSIAKFGIVPRGTPTIAGIGFWDWVIFFPACAIWVVAWIAWGETLEQKGAPECAHFPFIVLGGCGAFLFVVGAFIAFLSGVNGFIKWFMQL